MTPAHEAESVAQRLTSFQLHGDAAERYERWAVPFVVGPWVPGLLDLAQLRAGERVLDIACGTGVVSRLAARRVTLGGTVTGLDLNEGMLAVARRLPLPPGLTIDWRQGSALALPVADGAFDVALCQQGLQFFPDRLKALSEMRPSPDAYGPRCAERLDRTLSVLRRATRGASALRERRGSDLERRRVLPRRRRRAPRPSRGHRLSRRRHPPCPHDASPPAARGVLAETPVWGTSGGDCSCGRRRSLRGVGCPHEEGDPCLRRRIWLGSTSGGQRRDRACMNGGPEPKPSQLGRRHNITMNLTSASRCSAAAGYRGR